MEREIAIACDHAGIDLKKEIILMLQEQDYAIIDLGVHTADSMDYPDLAKPLAEAVLGKDILGIIICGTGIGVSISANKIKGIRAALCHNEYTAKMAREHNDANILALGARVIGVAVALEIVRTFLQTDFAGGRHERRVRKIMDLEKC